MADKIAEFGEAYPSVGFELISSTSPDTLGKLKEGRCDVAFVNLPVEDGEVRFLEPVWHLNDIFVAGNKYSQLKNKTVPLENIREFPLLLIEKNTVARRALSAFLNSLAIELAPDVEVSNWDFMLKLAVKGMGIGCVPREYCTEQLAKGELFEVKTSPALPVRGVGIALPKNVPSPYILKQFISFFRKDI